MESIIIICIVVFFLFLFYASSSSTIREGYRDPIYMNRAKYVFDYYPRANGSIYGMSYRQGGSWSVLSGFPFYDRAY